ncbi:hypothetical protein [Methanobrevibacter ruminantium]|uniref:hypothetical protein n=1 Tax=Methanobrevibacter ruminantium TaxID=83816 RepID=UPI003F0742E6
MTLNKHVVRNYNANKTNNIRYDDDKFRFEIFKFDKAQEMLYTVGKANFKHNGTNKWFDGMTGIKSKSSKHLILSFDYEAKEDGHYRIETLYTNSYTIEGIKNKKYNTASGWYTINGQKKSNSSRWITNDVTYSRNYQYVDLKKGKNTIVLEMTANMIFYGMAIKKYDIWESHYPLLHDDKLVPIESENSHTNEFRVNTMTAKFMYSHELDELLPITDSRANPTGLVFDYRDEINLYAFNTAGIEVNVFGGYISYPHVDEKLTTLTLECADRLIDMEHRFCLSEILLKGQDQDEKTNYSFANDCLKKFNFWSQGLKFICDYVEVPINTNVQINTPLIPRKEKTLATYAKGKYTNLTKSNITTEIEKDHILLRNGVERNKQQSIVIYDAKKKSIELNKYPNLFIHYGMGEEEREEEIVETTTIVKQRGVSKTVQKWADKYAKGVSGNNAVKPLWKSIVNNIKHNSKKKGFYQSPEKTLSSNVGNCCCKSELLLDLCNYKNVSDLHYVHVKPKNGGTGHVFCKINGKIVDPSTSRGWGDYYKKNGTLSNAKYTTYPTKPF